MVLPAVLPAVQRAQLHTPAQLSSLCVQAVALTALVVVSLTAYTFRAVRQGADFTFMAPALFTVCCSAAAPELMHLLD